MWLHNLFPDPRTVLALKPEELGGVLLEYFHLTESNGLISPFSAAMSASTQGFPQNFRRPILLAVTEASGWLVREGLIARDPEQGESWFFITRRGRSLKKIADVDAYRNAAILPPGLIHPAIWSRVNAAFLRGEYDVVVFQAFREVEIAVREAAGLTADEIGVPMVRKAFALEGGPLTDSVQPRGEREAEMHLFGSAIGLFKNPSSHRADVKFEPIEAVELILLASHLLRRVDRAMGRKVRSL